MEGCHLQVKVLLGILTFRFCLLATSALVRHNQIALKRRDLEDNDVSIPPGTYRFSTTRKDVEY